MYIMASSSGMSSLLDRFRFEQKPKKRITSSSGDIDDTHSQTTAKHGRTTGRPATPESQVITCIPETPTSEMPEFIESGSPVFPSSLAKKNIAKTSQRSLASKAISSLYSPGATKSPTFGKYKQLSNGHMKSERRQDRNRHIRFTDSESDSEDGDTQETAGSSRRVTKSGDKTMSDDDSDSTHITNAETQDSLETVTYSYEDHSEEGSQRRAGGLKRKLSEMSSANEGGDEEEDGDGGGRGSQKERDDAMEQLRICFPQKSNKVLRQTLESMNWNINQAANALMADEGSSPPRRKARTSPESAKQNGIVEPNKKHSHYKGASDGWLQKPSTSSKNLQLSKKKGRETSSSSDDEEEDEVQEVTTEKKSGQAKKVYRRIRTFSSDGTEDISPEKKSKPWQRIRVISDDSVDHERSDDERRPASPDGCHGDEAGGTEKRSPDVTGGPAKFYGGGRKPVRKVWCGFLPKEKQEAGKSAGKKQQMKKTSNSWQPKLAANSWQPKPTPKAKRRNYSDSEDEAESGGSESDYEEEEVEVTEEFRAQVVSFINDATVEELCSIDGCSKVKANRICSMRPFTSFTDVLERLDDYKGLGTHIVWNCEAVFEERSVMEDLLSRCVGISERIQKMVTAVISSNRDDAGGQSPDVSVEGQITRQPYLLNDSMTLKPYQLVGLNWLKLMHAQAVNGILADEMGLGKTIQVISFLAHLLEEGNKGPHLVVAPSSTVDNWARELNTWCPALEVILYHGSQEDRHEIRDELLYGESSCNVIVTSYNLCTSCSDDRSLFRKLPLQYAIFDEGHMLKNMKSQRYIHLMKFKAERRLLLTGTPLQNNLPELISLLAFTLPNLIGGKAERLQKVFCMKKQKTENLHEQSSYEMERIDHAKKIMTPFVLRRVKADVLKQLPKKLELVEHSAMTEEQARGYADLVSTLSRSLKSSESKMSAGKLSSAMMELRKQANHPLLIRRRYDDGKLRKMAKLMLKEPTHYDANEDYIFEDMQVMNDYELHRLCHEYAVISEYRLDKETILDSGKFRYLDKLLPELKQKGTRVLLFSQFVIVLDIVEDYLKMRGHKFLRMDGQTQVSERGPLIDKFNTDDSVFIFMLSTRAGGVGINLTAASYVVLHDIDFNPYNDKQAEDRCHRVGQTRDVTVTRLVSRNTIEEGMLSCANYKLKLERQMTSGKTAGPGEDEEKDIAKLLKEALDL
ncbi:SWI/SNF-related matrix-associated actin-dependent regulator of chromatin subfamily A containing DEAD/H box 1-like [Diadema setosum]|uniref:SWI/SNF-related matrix-associated actin-dependent regulator of chromatin subfamily A containing DEAD/H box 1-like n=1 Tax=Diadema setosum TaxID=31175 RepID=UPI003B3A1547